MKHNESQGVVTPVVVASLYDEFSSSHNSLDTLSDWVAKGSPEEGLIQVPIEDIVLEESLQVRKQTHQPTVKKYAEAMDGGVIFPPVALAVVDGMLVLCDGWHRLAARKMLGQSTVAAVVTRMSYEEARWYAGRANLEHGLQLAASEIVNVFHAYIEAKEYRKGHKWKSYREIGTELGKGHTTIRLWMERHYPRLFKKYQERATGKDREKAWDGSSGRKAKQAVSLSAEVLEATQVAMNNAKSLGTALDRLSLGELIEKMRETLQELEKHPYYIPSPSERF